MAKKKKSKGKDARGYSQGGVLPTSNKSNKAPSVSQKTHTDMKELLHQFDNNDSNNATNSHTSSQTDIRTNNLTNNASLVVASDRFTSRLTNIITTLDKLQFAQSHIEQVARALQYDITIESALDYLCLNIPTIELPALFTDAELKQSLSEVQSGVDSLLVVRNDKSSSTTGKAEGGEDKISQSDNILVVDSNTISKDNTGHGCSVQQRTDATAKDKEEDELEKQRKEEHKNWLLQQYAYEDENEVDDYEGVNDTAATVDTGKSANVSSHQPIDNDKPDTQPLSPEEQQLATAEATLNELQADLNNDANNYMRSKVEIKQLANQVNKMKQKVNGLKKKVERKALQRQLVEEKVDGETEKNESVVVVDKTAVDEEEEEEGPPLFDMFAKADDEEDDAEEKDTTTTATEDKQPTQSLDFTIPKTWTGAIPTKKLDEVLKKQKLPRAKYMKLPMNSGYALSVTLDKSKKSPTVKSWEGKNVDFIKDSSIKDYLALHALYTLDSSIPLYQVFPPVFRNLWLSWVNEEKAEKDDAQKAEDEAQKDRIDGLLSLIADMHVSDSRKSSEGTVPKASVQDNAGEDREDNHDEILLDNWDDDDDNTTDNLPTPIPKQCSSKGKKMQADFIKRQSTQSYQKMKAIRDSLPMSSYRSNILETMANNPVTILCAETGAGKSTQAAQYIIEQAILDGQGDNVNIICTQPRRVAATSLAERVADEMCDQLGKLVGYQIRMESKRSAHTRLMFCTTGVILRRLQDDQNLTGITHVIVDEVHERQQQIDVLLIILRQLLQTTRLDLKVILMSATMETELFTNFFNGAPLISVPGRTFPVSNYYLEDLLDATGHVIEEGSRYAIRENHYGETASLMISTRGGEKRKERVDLTSQVEAIGVSDAYAGYKMTTRRSMERVNEEIINYDLIEDLLKLVTSKEAGLNDTLIAPDGADMSSGSILIFLPGIGEIRALIERLEGSRLFRDRQKFDFIPLHSTLSSKDQRRAFLLSKPGCRKIICATNIAETSVTIPDVVCVIDTGRVREVRRNKRTSSSMLVTDWVPRSSSKQRQGRAGRVQSGICLKLYSSYTAESIMKQASEPELRRVPLEEVCMQILASGFARSCADFLSQAPQPPSDDSIKAAITVLKDVGAIESDDTTLKSERLTPLGLHLAKLPVDVKLGKMLIYGALLNCIGPIVTIAACLSSKSPFAAFANDAAVAKAKQKVFTDPDSDFMTYCNVWDAYSKAAEVSTSEARRFCNDNYLSFVALREISEARRQFIELLIGIGFLHGNGRRIDFNQLKKCKHNRNAKKVDVVNAALCSGLYPNIAHLEQYPSLNISIYHGKEQLYFHRNSTNASKKRFTNSENWLVFHEKFGTATRTSISTTAFVHPIALILFGGSVVVNHTERTVTIDEWMNITMAAQTGCILRELRNKMNLLLQGMIEGSTANDLALIDGITNLLV